jgi:hypothetical protein
MTQVITLPITRQRLAGFYHSVKAAAVIYSYKQMLQLSFCWRKGKAVPELN